MYNLLVEVLEERKIKIDNVREVIYYAYANLAMAHSAINKKQEKYERINFMIRSKLYKGLKEGKVNIRSIFDDEKIKLNTGRVCNYCGSAENLALDHIFPKKLGGQDNAENLVLACKKCNSSKGKKDLMQWMYDRKKFLPLSLIRRYLKLTYDFCHENSLLDKKIDELYNLELPFNIEYIPIEYPNPNELTMNINDNNTI